MADHVYEAVELAAAHVEGAVGELTLWLGRLTPAEAASPRIQAARARVSTALAQAPMAEVR